MSFLVAVILVALTLLLLLVMLYQHSTGKVELISLRNIAMVGFIVFQLTSVAFRMYTNQYATHFKLVSPAASGLEFTALAIVFLIVFALFYERGWGVRRLALKIPSVPPTTNPATLLFLALLLTLLAVPLRFAVNIPWIGVASNFVGVGAAAMACGLAGWVWAPRLFNPLLAAFVLFLLAVNLTNVMTGAFGRRSIVTIFGCMVWGMYYSHWRYLPTRTLFTRMAAVCAGPIIFLALYTSVRSAAEHDRSAGDHISAIESGGNVASGLAMMLDGQATGPAGLWIIEHYPEDFRPRYFFTAEYFFGINVPRFLWPGKPEPLSTSLADKARISGVQQDRIKLSCGIIGVSAAEGGFLAAIVYGALGGLFLRFFDQIVRQQPTSPFVVMPVAAAIGQVLGLARGDTSTFANTYMITTLGSLAIMIPIGRFMSRFETDHPEVFDDYGEPAEADLLEDPDRAA